MKTKRAGCVLGIGLLALAGSANATTVELMEAQYGPFLSMGQTLSPTEEQSGKFEEHWYFQLASKLAGLTGSITSSNISGLDAQLTNLTTGQVVATGTNFSVSSLAMGKYDLEIEGNAGTSGGSVSGHLTTVPIPAAAWLFLSGLIAMGLVARRRRAG